MISNQENLPYTGERLVPSLNTQISVEHLARYTFCLQFIKDKIVLDLACGEGYGSSLIALSALKVLGIDIDEATIRHASLKYKHTNLTFTQASALSLPLADHSIDVIISFETIEHIAQQAEALTEWKRVLRKDGLLIISTPNYAEYTLKNNYRNPFHIKEFNKEEFKIFLLEKFLNVSILMQRYYTGSVIEGEESSKKEFNSYTGNFSGVNSMDAFKDDYFVALVSDGPLPPISNIFFHDNNIFEAAMQSFEKGLRATITYRTGQIILAPLKFLKAVFNKKA